MSNKPVSEPNHVAVDLYRGQPRMVNGKRHVTRFTEEIRVVNVKGETVCMMDGRDQAALDRAWEIAAALDRMEVAQQIEIVIDGFVRNAQPDAFKQS